MNIYVDNLAPETTREDLLKAFQAHGAVSSVSLMRTQMRGRHGRGPSHGMGLVVMPDGAQAKLALAALNLQQIRGRAMTVLVARPAGSRRPRG
jgi:RNA recognition motif-containing protein